MESKGKRGRKPKVVEDVSSSPAVTNTNPCQVGDEPIAVITVKSRRGRKPKQTYKNFDNTDFFQSNSDNENIIMKLKVSNNVGIEVLPLFDDTILQPDAYNEMQNNSYASKPCEFHDVMHDDINVIEHKATNLHGSCVKESGSHLKVIELLKDFEEKNKNNEWPQTTTICCYWCCHKFETAPFGIPVKYVDAKFHVYGCFCSLECAAAYNFSSKESVDEVWERHNLLSLLSKTIGNKEILKSAPNRLALYMFGGHLSIEEFRNFCWTSKIININFPPMMTMTQQIEEINESDLNKEYKYIPIDTDRINKYKDKIKLKRTKPLTTFENTLDHAMNLKFESGSN
jgi:hypothetical protein